jgi:hypothetical protein
MPEHLSGEEAGRYRRRALSAAELLRFDEHLDSCAECRAAIASPDELAELAAILSSADFSHLEYEQLAAYTDGTADGIERELVETHTADCALCRRELKDLQKFAEKPRQPWRWAAAAAIAAAIFLALFLTLPRREAQHALVALVALHDGGRQVTLRSDGQVTGLPRVSAAQQRAIARALSRGELPQAPDIAALRGSRHTILGEAGVPTELQPIAPLGCIVVDDRPTLAWSQLPGVTRYRAELFDSHFRPVAASGVVRETRWTVDVPLHRGDTYVWQVTAFANDREVTAPAPPAPMARFGVLDASRAKEIDRLAAQQPPSHLALGIAYAEAGALPDAEREFRTLVDENRGNGSAQRLLESVRSSAR